MAPTGSPDNSTSLLALSPRERQRLRLLALRYRVRRDTSLRSLANVMFAVRSRHGLRLSRGQALELVSARVGR